MHPDPVADANHPPFHFLVHAVPVEIACEVLHRSRTSVYELLGLGKLDGVKDGKRTLVTLESIRRYQAAMPPATIKRPPPPRLDNLVKLRAKQRAERRARADRRRKARARG